MSRLEIELQRGVLSASEIRERLDISRPTLMRAVHEASANVVAIGRARATRYGLRQTWPSLDTSRFPLFRIDETGKAQNAGELFTLAARETVWQPDGVVSRGLPIEIADARPAGFLGRVFAATHHDLGLPLRLEDWSDHHILIAVCRRGEDLPGNLIVGDESFARWQRLDATTQTRAEYPALARATLAGNPPVSSAGGERPKFGVLVDGRHLLVKFAARGTGDPVATRWRDLLLLEGLALQVVAARGVPAARTETFETDDHSFLESERFDRVGARGRISVISLAAAHGEPAQSWAQAAARLVEAGRLTGDDARHLRWLDAFGALIGNTDRHHYNVVFFTNGASLRLAPAYDQAPVLYAPSADGQVLARAFARPVATADTLDVWDDAQAAAREYWRRAADDDRLSHDIRGIAAGNARMLDERR